MLKFKAKESTRGAEELNENAVRELKSEALFVVAVFADEVRCFTNNQKTLEVFKNAPPSDEGPVPLCRCGGFVIPCKYCLVAGSVYRTVASYLSDIADQIRAFPR